MSARKEGALRARCVERLQASEAQLRALGQEETALKAGIEQLWTPELAGDKPTYQLMLDRLPEGTSSRSVKNERS